MSVMYVMQLPGMTKAQYETIRSILGEDLRNGALLHLAAPIEGGWQIVEVWESPEAMAAFVQSEAMAEAMRISGITPVRPVIFPVHTHVAVEMPTQSE